MQLLYWGTVRPAGESGVAALRFTTALRVALIRVFASETQPFVHCPDAHSHTEPDAFYLDIFFNAIPDASAVDSNRRNVLVPTSIVYTGGTVDYPMDMGQHSTRLMILKGSFHVLSFALYGHVVSALSSPTTTYTPLPLPLIPHVALVPALHPANSADPTLLATTLLKLIPDAPPLHLVIRLMCCLKPTDDDWENPSFPYHGTSLDIPQDFDLDVAADIASRPVIQETSENSISTFAQQVGSLIGAKTLGQSDSIARLLCASASQVPSLGLALCLNIDTEAVFDAASIDDGVLSYLLDAVANADLARHCNSEEFISIINQCIANPLSDKATKAIGRRLLERIHSWTSLEEALNNTGDEYTDSIVMVKDIGTEERSLGIWLESMVLNKELVTKLAENQVSSGPLRNEQSSGHDHASFISYIRAFIGVSCVFVVWAWADSVGSDEARERALSIIKLWQTVEGYSQITNHLLLLRQFSRRLKWITARDYDYDDDPPRKSGCIGEEIISELGKNPDAMAHEDFRETVFSLKPPMSFLAEGERTRLRKTAFVADDGLPAALEELFFESDQPTISLRRLHVLRVALSTIARVYLEGEEGELQVIQAAWDKFSSGLLPRLIELVADVSRDLNGHFALTLSTPPPFDRALVEQLLSVAHDIMHLLIPLSTTFPLIPRSIRDLTSICIDIFCSADSAMSVFAQSTSLRSICEATRRYCMYLVQRMLKNGPCSGMEKHPSQIVLVTLLSCAAAVGQGDPVHRVAQCLLLFDHILPDDEETKEWVHTVLPLVLNPMKAFFKVLKPEQRIHVIDRLICLDDGEIGVAEWLLIEDLKVLLQTLICLRLNTSETPHSLALKSKATIVLHFLSKLIKTTSNWFLATLKDVPDVHTHLKDILTTLLDGRFRSRHLSEFVRELGSFVDATDFGDLTSDIAIGYLGCVQVGLAQTWDVVILRRLLVWSTPADSAALRQELGRSLWAVAQSEEPSIDLVEGAIIIVEWLVAHKNPNFPGVCGITVGDTIKVEEFLEAVVLPEQSPLVEQFKNLSTSEDEEILSEVIDLDAEVTLCYKDLLDIFQPESVPPSTPKGTTTPDVLGVILSPPNALLYSPMASTLTKNYANNDFRDLRQTPSARQNTSRLPSMHVDVGINGPST